MARAAKKTTATKATPRRKPESTSDPELEAMSVEELLSEGNRLAAERAAILARQREVSAMLDRRALEQEERRRTEAALLGQTTRPPTQSVF
jgi:hypothetical protein